MRAGKIQVLVIILVIFGSLLSGCVLLKKEGPPSKVIVLVKKPHLVLIKEIDVWFAPDLTFELYWYKDIWYLYWEKHWYWSDDYNGPWIRISPGKLPAPFLKIPPGIKKK